MRRLFKYFILSTALSTTLVGCEKNVVEGNAITFDVQMAGAAESVQDAQTKAAGLFKDANLNSLGQFQVTAYDGETKDIDNRTVKRFNSGIWGFEDNPTIWPDGHTRTFWASANLPSYVTVTSNNSSQATISVSALPSAVGDQWDPLIGYYQGPGDAGKATIIFYHPFTAVSFKTGKTDGNVTGINSVKLSSVHKSATATVTGSSTSLTYNWSETGKTSVSGDFNSGKSANPFILIPQNVSIDNVKITVTVSLSGGGTKDIDADLVTGDWQSGIIYQYILDYIPTYPMEGTLKVTLSDWGYLPDSGKKYFDADFDK